MKRIAFSALTIAALTGLVVAAAAPSTKEPAAAAIGAGKLPP